jgi:hypothetical protein
MKMEYIFGLIVLAAVLYEGYAMFNGRTGDTISEIMWTLSTRPLVPFLIGVLCGHFFWQRV